MTACGVDELRAASGQAAALDLTWVTLVDHEAAALLSQLARQGVRLVNVPQFIATLLEETRPC